MTTFRAIVPDSEKQPLNERFEHFMVWLSPSGIIRQWLFSHTAGNERVNVDGYTVENETDIRSIPTEIRKEFNCETRFMTSKEFDYVRSIFDSNRCWKVFKDGTRVPVSVKQSRTTRPNQIKGFEISMSFMLQENDTLSL